MSQYPPGGVLFRSTKKKNDKSPDYFGSIEIDQALLDEIQDQLRSNDRAKLDLAGWRKQGQKGDFISLRANKPYNASGGGGSPSGGGGSQRGDPGYQAPAPGRGGRSPLDDLDDSIPF